jgi:hypothetical protein
LVGAGAGAALATGNRKGVVVTVEGAGAGTAVVKRGGAGANSAVTTSDPAIGAGVPIGAGDGGMVGAPGFRATPLTIHLVWVGLPLAVGALDGAGVIPITIRCPNARAEGGIPLATDGASGRGDGAIARGGNGFIHGFGLSLGVGVEAFHRPTGFRAVALAINGAGFTVFPSEGDFSSLSHPSECQGSGQRRNEATHYSHKSESPIQRVSSF